MTGVQKVGKDIKASLYLRNCLLSKRHLMLSNKPIQSFLKVCKVQIVPSGPKQSYDSLILFRRKKCTTLPSRASRTGNQYTVKGNVCEPGLYHVKPLEWLAVLEVLDLGVKRILLCVWCLGDGKT